MIGERWVNILKSIFFPILSIALVGNEMNCADTASPDRKSVFQFEYDYMTGYNVFANGETKARNAFSTCNTDLTIAYDDTDIVPMNINWRLPILDTMMNHATTWPGVDPNDFVFNAYLLGMNKAVNIPSNENLDAFGVTFRLYDSTLDETFVFSAIFVQTIRDYGSYVQPLLEKTVIHELGHSRLQPNFSHSCEFNGTAWVSSPYHNDPACVMGMGRINACNSIDITINPHFCPADCERLKKVTW